MQMTKYVEGDFDLGLHDRLTICTAAVAALILYTICWQKRLRETVKTSDDLTTQQAYGVVDKVTNLGSRCMMMHVRTVYAGWHMQGRMIIDGVGRRFQDNFAVRNITILSE